MRCVFFTCLVASFAFCHATCASNSCTDPVQDATSLMQLNVQVANYSVRSSPPSESAFAFDDISHLLDMPYVRLNLSSPLGSENCLDAFSEWIHEHEGNTVNIMGKDYIVVKVKRGNPHVTFSSGVAFLDDADGTPYVLKLYTKKPGVNIGMEGPNGLIQRMARMRAAGFDKNHFEVLVMDPGEDDKPHYHAVSLDHGCETLGLLVDSSCPRGTIKDFAYVRPAERFKYRDLISQVLSMLAQPGRAYLSVDLHPLNMMLCSPDGTWNPSTSRAVMVDMKMVFSVGGIHASGGGAVVTYGALLEKTFGTKYKIDVMMREMNIPFDTGVTEDNALQFLWRWLESQWLGYTCVPASPQEGGPNVMVTRQYWGNDIRLLKDPRSQQLGPPPSGTGLYGVSRRCTLALDS